MRAVVGGSPLHFWQARIKTHRLKLEAELAILRETEQWLAERAESSHRDLERAVQLLHMLDNQEARHPDVAEFLDAFEERARKGEKG